MGAVANIGEYLGVTLTSDFDVAELVERGLPPESLDILRARGLSMAEIAEVVISPRAAKNRVARGEPLSHEETDRVVRIARVAVLAESVFGSREKAMLWLRGSDDRMNGRSPLGMLQTDAGGRVVESILWQIDEGVYS